ncbi:hypothetical protein [Bradyrhizobium hipponense]|uniref:hypothetical protein n=1 Tax=Bradyrhizobium hipponense TaxID=2605638 RepID=UPI001653392D|nr:hypothetical protein [Bradyrhizobium hipponense]
MPSGDDDEIAARCTALLVFGELFFGRRLFGERFFGRLLVRELVREALAGRAFWECRTLIRFWSSTIVNCTRAELISIRQPIAMHMGFAVRTHALRQV